MQVAEEKVTTADHHYFELWITVKQIFERFVYLKDSRHYELLTSLVFCSYVQDSLDYAPYVQLIGQPNVGKSTVLKVLNELCFDAYRFVAETSAVLFRTIDANFPCTALLDEVGSYTEDFKEAIGAILRAGNEMDATVTRTEPNSKNQYTPRKFKMGGVKVFAGSLSFARALSSRCIKITMTRAPTTSFRKKRKSDISLSCCKAKIALVSLRQRKGLNTELFQSETLFEGNDRVYDIFQGLLTVCPNEETRQVLTSLGNEMMEEERAEEEDTLDTRVKEAIYEIGKLQNLRNGDLMLTSEIVDKLILDDPQINPSKIGWACKRLGFKKGRQGNKRCIVFKEPSTPSLPSTPGYLEQLIADSSTDSTLNMPSKPGDPGDPGVQEKTYLRNYKNGRLYCQMCDFSTVLRQQIEDHLVTTHHLRRSDLPIWIP